MCLFTIAAWHVKRQSLTCLLKYQPGMLLSCIPFILQIGYGGEATRYRDPTDCTDEDAQPVNGGERRKQRHRRYMAPVPSAKSPRRLGPRVGSRSTAIRICATCAYCSIYVRCYAAYIPSAGDATLHQGDSRSFMQLLRCTRGVQHRTVSG